MLFRWFGSFLKKTPASLLGHLSFAGVDEVEGIATFLALAMDEIGRVRQVVIVVVLVHVVVFDRKEAVDVVVIIVVAIRVQIDGNGSSGAPAARRTDAEGRSVSHPRRCRQIFRFRLFRLRRHVAAATAI